MGFEIVVKGSGYTGKGGRSFRMVFAGLDKRFFSKMRKIFLLLRTEPFSERTDKKVIRKPQKFFHFETVRKFYRFIIFT